MGGERNASWYWRTRQREPAAQTSGGTVGPSLRLVPSESQNRSLIKQNKINSKTINDIYGLYIHILYGGQEREL